MDSQTPKNHRPSRRQAQKARNRILFIVVFSAILAAGAGYFLFSDKLRSLQEPTTTPQADGGTTAPITAKTPQEENQLNPPGNSSNQMEKTQGTDKSNSTASLTPEGQSDVQASGDQIPVVEKEITDDKENALLNTPEVHPTCEPETATIKEFYAHLDEQEYLKPYQLGKPSEEYFSILLQKVVDNPPIVTGETDDLFNILKNTAHFFRIFGKKNIFTLKAILDREKDSFEKVLSDFYQLTGEPGCLEQGFGLHIPKSSLYDYAGFFLNTMGGRLYLFRRDSVSRMAVSYYSILIVDEANSNGTNKHGVDLAPSIKSLIDELENNGSVLRMRDEYLDTLYILEQKYM